MSTPELLTVDEAADFLRISRKQARNMIDRGQMPGLVRKDGLPLRVRRRDLLEAVGLLGGTSPNGSGSRP